MSASPPIPIYFTISQEIIDQIQRRKIKAGEKVPSENEIIRKYRVSNTTARKVLQEIERGGYVEKIKGKGTFVRHNISISRSASKVLSFTKNMQQMGIASRTSLLDVALMEGGISKNLKGRIYTLKDQVYRISRLRYADDKPILKEIRYISKNFCPGIDQHDLEKSLYNIYENKYKLQITRIVQTLSATIIDPGEQDFGNEQPIAGFKVEGVTFCGTEMILEMEESIYNGEIYTFSIEATP